jgi:hypothetical protein
LNPSVCRDDCLLVVDLQKGFHPSEKLLERMEQEVHKYSIIAMTQFINRPDSLYRTVLGWNGDGGELALRIPGSVIIQKFGYGLKEEQTMRLKAISSKWHLCGLETDACVLACAFSLWDAGIQPVILYDLCESPLHKEGVAVAQRQFQKSLGNSNQTGSPMHGTVM